MGSGAVGIESILWHVQLVVQDNDEDNNTDDDDNVDDNDKTKTEKGDIPTHPPQLRYPGALRCCQFFSYKDNQRKISVPPTTETFTGKKCLKLGPEN